MRVALDTNILGYAEGVNGEERKQEALELIRRLPTGSIVVPVQALLELFSILVRKAGLSRSEAEPKIAQWIQGYQPVASTSVLLTVSLELAVRHRLQIFDAMIFAAAAESKCGLLLSEDMHEGFTWGGVTVTNPFAANRHVWLDVLLSET